MWSSIYREKFCPFSVRRDKWREKLNHHGLNPVGSALVG
jgi:hypothetical protein